MTESLKTFACFFVILFALTANAGGDYCSKVVVTPQYLSELRDLAMKPSRIDRAGPVYVRRGDEFRLPHIQPEAAGDKLRQVLLILLDQLEAIRDLHGGLITTYTGAQSPQGIFVATAAKALGLDVLIGFGGNSVSQSLQEHVLLRKCADLGCRMEVLSKSGYNTVLRARIHELLEREKLSGKMIKCGMADCAEDVGSPRLLEEFLDLEVRSIPSQVQNLVIPAGTGNSAGLLIRSLIRNQRKLKRVIVVQNQNLNHQSTIDQIIGQGYPYEYATYGNVPYQKWVDVDIALDRGGRLALDGRVEAKVWDWMMKNVLVNEEPTLFWNIADTRGLRDRK